MKKSSLVEINPELAKEWHPTKNGKLTPKDIVPKSHKRVWWLCKKGHEWEARIARRSCGDGCPYCAGQKVCEDNCLATKNPSLAEEWHPTKNGSLTPKDVTPGSSKKIVWWRCEKGHEWEMKILHRSHGQGCPFCVGKRACKDNCLATKNPSLAEEWHPTKNGSLAPKDVTPGSGRKVWWICKKGHEWGMRILHRSHGSSCPYCSGRSVCKDNCLATKNPSLAKEWHLTKNGSLTPKDVTPGSKKKVWWICKKGHEWEAAIKNRNYGNGCEYCNSQTSMMELRIYTELKTIFLDAELRKRIGKIECDIYFPSIKVGIEYDGEYWHCKKHEKDRAKNIALEKKGIKLIRVREGGLDKISEDDIIYYRRKKQEKELVDRLLKKIERVAILSSFDKGRAHQYLNRSRFANNNEFLELLDMLPSPLPGKSLVDLNPCLSREWHPCKNGKLTAEDVMLRSNKKVWWICDKGHEWQAVVANRSRGTGCPYCSGRKVHKDNDLT